MNIPAEQTSEKTVIPSHTTSRILEPLGPVAQERQLHKSINNINDSYNDIWDVLSELVQNSADAIALDRMRYPESEKEHRIDLIIDAKTNSITIVDNGTGFESEDDIFDCLKPNVSLKEDIKNQIGYKGVGLTYLLSNTNNFVIDTISRNGSWRVNIKNVLNWRKSKVGSGAAPIADDIQRTNSGGQDTKTTITLHNLDESFQEIFSSNPKVLETILRTRTAIGNIDYALENKNAPEPFQVSLKLITDSNPNPRFQEIPYGYMLPEEIFESKNLIDLKNPSDVANIKKKKRGGPESLRKHLKNKNAVVRDSYSGKGRNSDYSGETYLFFAKNHEWEKHLKKLGIENVYPKGITIADRGIPSSVKIPVPDKGELRFYWANCLAIINSSSGDIRLDMGRKNIPATTQAMYKNIAREVYNDYLVSEVFRYLPKKNTSPENLVPTVNSKHIRKQLFSKANSLEDLKTEGLGDETIGYLKEPDKQEASVIAIYHELIGQGTLGNYRTLTSSYGSRYDSLMLYSDGSAPLSEAPELVVEFKYSADQLIPELYDETKEFRDIDLLVCWEPNEKAFGRKFSDAYNIHSVESGKSFQGVTHVIDNNGEGIPVICLQDLLVQ